MVLKIFAWRAGSPRQNPRDDLDAEGKRCGTNIPITASCSAPHKPVPRNDLCCHHRSPRITRLHGGDPKQRRRGRGGSDRDGGPNGHNGYSGCKGCRGYSGYDGYAEQGSAIWFLFIGIALFGAMSYVFLHGSRNNLAMITDEATKTAAYQSQDCANSVALATRRLQSRGCGSMISMEPDGSNPHTGAPTDGSCSVYHPAGGAASPCNVVIKIVDPCVTGPIGIRCTSDGAIYIGDIDGHRIYARHEDNPGTTNFSGPSYSLGPKDFTDGPGNTDAWMAFHIAGTVNHHPVAACRSYGAQWYLPAKDELNLFWQNRLELDLPSIGIKTSGGGTYLYWSSSQNINPGMTNQNYAQRFDNGDQVLGYKTYSHYRARCTRRD